MPVPYEKLKNNNNLYFENVMDPTDKDKDEENQENNKARTPDQLVGTDNTASPILYCSHGKARASCFGPLHHDGNTTMTVVDGHCHTNTIRPDDGNKSAIRRLVAVSILCLIFMVATVFGGWLSNSLAIASDAAHLLTDFAGFMISLFSLWVASRPATQRMSFGWYRAEVIGALASVLFIWVVTSVLVYWAVQRTIHRDFQIDAKVMLITSGLGIVVNIVMGLVLCEHGHSHGGAAPSDNINIRAAFIHIIGDFIQSIGVLIAALIIFFQPAYILVDPICTFLFSVLVFLTTFNIVRDILTVLMEGKPNHVSFEAVMCTLSNIDSVVRVHNVRIWALSLNKTAVSAHLMIPAAADPQKVLQLASCALRTNHHFFEITLQIEIFQDSTEECVQYKDIET